MKPPRYSRPTERGFTLIEVLVALVVFAISVVGLVALQSRNIESQRAASQIREAERIAQDAMAELQSRGFLELVSQDFAGTANPSFPYDDRDVDAAQRLRDYRRPPADISSDDNVVGSVRDQYIVFRTVDWVVDTTNPPSNPPTLGAEEGRIRALVFDVVVLWIDDANPMFPPPANVVVSDLTPEMTEPGAGDFRPYVGRVRLRTVRINDSISAPSP